MIKCPKCGFQQPEDIYCASCGIKMDGYVKRGAGLATNWMVHVCILVILIIGFVIYDKLSRKPAPVATTTPAIQNSNSQARTQAPAATKMTGTVATIQDTDSEPAQKEVTPTTESANEDETSQATAPAPSTPSATAATGTRAGQAAGDAGLQVSFYTISKQGLTELQRISQAGNIQGASVNGVIARTRIAQLVSSGEMQYVSGNRFKDFDDKHPTMVFKGQRHPEAARNMGLFFQVSSLRKSENTHLIEVRGWGVLKASEPDDNFFSGELTLSPRTAAFVAGFVPKATVYSEDEKQLFESDRVLKTLNQEGFSDGSIDIIMFIEFAKSN